jgi:hypothetical protein
MSGEGNPKEKTSCVGDLPEFFELREILNL